MAISVAASEVGVRGVDTGQLSRRLAEDREERGLSYERLARMANVSSTWLRMVEAQEISKPGGALLTRVASALGYRSVAALLAGERAPDEDSLNVVRESEGWRPAGSVARPVYRWGSCGDPRTAEASPDPDRLEFPPVGKELLLGPRGFGVEVRGNSMRGWGIHDGDVVWVNPDRPARPGGVVLARCWNPEGEELGMAVKEWVRANGRDELHSAPESDGDTPDRVLYARFEVIGPVVLIQPPPYPPQRRGLARLDQSGRAVS